MKIALLQVNPTVGDVTGNARRILDALREAASKGADLAATPELALVGYLPRDLLLNPGFVRRSKDEHVCRHLSSSLEPPDPTYDGRAVRSRVQRPVRTRTQWKVRLMN